jgi:hypothetical protein
MSAGAALGASLLAVLATPATWVLALASFLVRGGIVLVLLPIVTVPSAVGLGNVLGPLLTDIVLGDTVAGFIMLGGATLGAAVLWLGVGGWLAAAAEAETIRLVAMDDDVAPVGAGPVVLPRWVAFRILLVRLVASLPLLVALAVGGTRIVLVSYRELTVPSGGGLPLVVRVVGSAVDAVVLIGVTWILGEVVAALAGRRVALGGAGILGSIGRAIVDVVRHPLTVLVATLVPLVALLVVLVPSAIATGAAWGALRTTLADDPGPLPAIASIALFIVLWLGGLVLTGLVAAWRGAVWTVLAARTFGGVATTRPGEWSNPTERGTLTGLRPDAAERDTR